VCQVVALRVPTKVRTIEGRLRRRQDRPHERRTADGFSGVHLTPVRWKRFNSSRSAFSLLNFAQSIYPSLCAHDSSRSALASFRSAVSKPSVNQLRTWRASRVPRHDSVAALAFALSSNNLASCPPRMHRNPRDDAALAADILRFADDVTNDLGGRANIVYERARLTRIEATVFGIPFEPRKRRGNRVKNHIDRLSRNLYSPD